MINCKGSFFLLLAFLTLVIPMQWLVSAIMAAATHELAHYIAIRITGNMVYSLELTPRGTVMHTSAMTLGQELLCAAAGPLGSMLLFCGYPWIPRIALCAGVQGAFNLLPVGTLDGGRILSCFLKTFFSHHAAKIVGKIAESVVLVLGTVGIAGICRQYRLGYGAVFLLLLFLSRCLSEKFLAKKDG